MTNRCWQAEDVLAILGDFNLRPGRSLPVKTLWHKMGRGRDVGIGVEALVASGHVELNEHETDIILTEQGYRELHREASLGKAKPEAEPEALGAGHIPRRAVILTALEVETRAVLRHLTEINEITVKHTVFHVGRFGPWEIAVAECGAGNARAASMVERAIDHFNPEAACFVGIAGGVKDVDIGDIVVASKVYGYESGKEGKTGFVARPEISLPAYVFEQRARAVRLKVQWRARLDRALKHVDPKIHVGPLAAGEKVIASTRSATAELLRANYGDTLGVEMEGRGFLDGVYINNPVHGCLVRGISDLLDDKEQTDKDGCQKIAADAASAVMFELLFTLPGVGGSKVATTDHVIAKPARDDVPDVRVADDPGVRSMFEGGERDKMLPLLAAGKLEAWGRRGNGFPPLSAIPSDHWKSHFLEYHAAPVGGINQTFLKANARPFESEYYDVHLNREQLKRVWDDRLDFVPLLEAARIVFDQTKDTMSAGMARAEGNNDAALTWYCYMLIGVRCDGVTRLMELSGTRPPSRVREPIPYDRPPPHLQINNNLAVLVELPSRRILAENLMVPVSSIPGAVSFISGLDGSARGVPPNTIVNAN